MESQQISSFFAPPTVWISVLRAPRFDETNLEQLNKGYYGASIMPVEALKEMQRRLPQVRLWNLYGQTEIAPVATILKPEDQLRKAGSAGRPGLNVETRVVDDELNDVRPGEIGEIVQRSPQLMSGYYRDDDRPREAFMVIRPIDGWPRGTSGIRRANSGANNRARPSIRPGRSWPHDQSEQKGITLLA